jgi:ABC-2 type transport system ATP-binding protein/ribosome-dependent ATPase
MSAIEARDLRKEFHWIVAVDDLSFTVAPGEVVGLLGANGAGKTTTMRMLLGLLTPTSGVARIAGKPIREVDRRVMGYVPQGLGLYRELTVAENVQFAAAAFGVAMPRLDESDLHAVVDRRVGELSLGMQRRVAFVVARCHQPEVLILDEPTSGVGPLGRARLWETIHETAEAGTAVLVSTHYMDEAEECDRVVLMAGGRQVATGTVADVIGSARSVAIAGDVSESAVSELHDRGATVLLDHDGWRVVGSDVATVSEIVGSGVEVTDVPASFEEAFVALSS